MDNILFSTGTWSSNLYSLTNMEVIMKDPQFAARIRHLFPGFDTRPMAVADSLDKHPAFFPGEDGYTPKKGMPFAGIVSLPLTYKGKEYFRLTGKGFQCEGVSLRIVMDIWAIHCAKVGVGIHTHQIYVTVDGGSHWKKL
jgi:hypothetical protein